MEKWSEIASAELQFSESGNVKLDPKLLSDRIIKQIEYASKRYEYYESERARLLTAAVAMIGFGSIFITLATRNDVGPGVKISSLIFVLSLLGTSFFTIINYISQMRERYTHRENADVYGWYFRYIVSADIDSAIIKNSDDFLHAQNVVAIDKNFRKFCKDWMSKNFLPVKDDNTEGTDESDFNVRLNFSSIYRDDLQQL